MRFALDPILFHHVPFITFFIAVYVASLLGGMGAGLTATALSAVAGAYFIAEPRFKIYIGDFGDVLQLALFVVFGVIITVSNHRLRAATARLRAAATELESRNRVMNMALTAAMSGSWELNLQTGRLSWDEASDRLYGLAPDFVPSLPAFYSLIHPEDVDCVTTDIERCRNQQIAGFHHAFRVILPDGVRFMESRAQVDRDPAGRPARLIGITSDVTERRRAEEERSKLEATLREARQLESVGRLAGGVAHDFNNLLAVINGYAALLAERLSDRDPLKTYTDRIVNAGARAAEVVGQLLAFSQKQAIRPVLLDLNQLIREAEAALRQLLGKRCELLLALAPSLGSVLADPGQIRQVLSDLIINASEAMPDGGFVEIATANFDLEPTAGGPENPDPGPYVLVTVTDTGMGMTPEHRSRIFEPFFTVKKLRGVGAGLGLATVHGMVRQNRGWIDVQSEEGQGSCFHIYLPRVDLAPQPAGQESAAVEKPTSKQ
jgi:PAS domain S-box-containing protein